MTPIPQNWWASAIRGAQVRRLGVALDAEESSVLVTCWRAGKFDGEEVLALGEAATYVFDDPMRLEREGVFGQGEYRNIVTVGWAASF